MSGHSKWHNIQAKKSKTDAARAKVFTKIGKEIAIAIRDGGPNPNSNSKLRDLISKAKANNVPNDNIDRIIKKASGETDVEYEELYYEELMKRVATSRRKTNVKAVMADTDGSYGGTKPTGEDKKSWNTNW